MSEILRLSLAAILAVASVAKLWDLAGARTAMRSVGAPAALARPLAAALAVVEAVIAVLLFPANLARPAAVAAAALFLLFAITVAVVRLRGRTPDCHCFGRLYSSQAGWPVVARNFALAAAAVVVASRPASVISAMHILVFGVAVLVLGQAYLVFVLTRRYGRSLERIEALEARPEEPATPPVPAAGNGTARTALAGGAAAAAAAGAAVTTAAVAEAARVAPPTDPELKAIDDLLRASGPKLVAASQRSLKAIRAQATLKTGKSVPAKRTAARRALAAERREVLALRAKVRPLAGTSPTAHNVKAMTDISLSLLAQSLQKREQAIGKPPKTALKLVDESQKLFLRSIGSSAAAGKLLGRGS